MITFFQNSWTIGIIGGIISGLIVYFVTSSLFRKKQTKEYFQKVKLANSEILYSMRPLIIAETQPSLGTLNAVINATAVKYGLKKIDLLDENGISDELTKEILDNFFLTPAIKLKYCQHLEELKDLSANASLSVQTKTDENILKETKLSDINFINIMFSVITACSVGLITSFMKKDVFEEKNMSFISPRLIITILTLISLPIFITACFTFFKQFKKRNFFRLQDDALNDSDK